jgi:predicted RND superfamily exporter protein
MSEQDAKQRILGFLIGENGTASVLVRPTERGVREQSATLEDVFVAADETHDLGRDQLRMAGTIYESFAVDQAAEKSLVQLVPPSSILGLVVAWCCLRQLRYAICVLVLAGLGQLIAVAFVFYSGNQFSAVLIVLPTLVFMLTLSGAVHLINYYRDAVRMNAPQPSLRAVKLGWKPCVLSSLTTVFGMGSLWTSQLAPVREFGLFSAVSLTLATLVLLLVFPTVIDWISRRQLSSLANSVEHAADDSVSTVAMPQGQPQGDEKASITGEYVKLISRAAWQITISSILLLVASTGGLYQLRASTKFTDMFPTQSRVNQDMYWIEANLGPISTIEVLMKFSDSCVLTSFEKLQYVQQIGESLRAQPEIGGVMSAASVLPGWSDSNSVGAVARRAAVRNAIQNNLSTLKEQGWIAEANDEEIWRLICKVSATSSKDYGELVALVKGTCDAVLDGWPSNDSVRLEYTGLTPIMHQTQITLLRDLGYSFLTAFLLITPLMMWITRSWRGGLLVMIPNVLPVTIVFGMMGWMGFSLDIAGILTASVAMGIAVDDTLHFVCWYMHALRSTNSRKQAVFESFKACSAAMFHTTLISCLSMMPFLFAGFLPTQQFAKLMILMLSGAIVGDLLVLPALLMSPWGVVIGKSMAQNAKGNQ